MSRKEDDVSRRTSRALPALVLGLLLPVLACKKSETSTASSPGTAPVSATESAPAAVRVTDVQIGKALGADNKIPAPTDTFAPKDTIFVSVATDGAAPSATIYAKWTYQDGQTIKTDSRTIAPTGPAVTEFSIQKPEGWPKGGYKVDISIDGQAAASSRSFRVE